MKNIITIILALALSACLVNPAKIDRIKRQLGEEGGPEKDRCLRYVMRAIPVLEREGYKTRIHFFDCDTGEVDKDGKPITRLHVMVTVNNTTLGVDSDHDEALTLHQMERECPLAGGKLPPILEYPPFGPPDGNPPTM